MKAIRTFAHFWYDFIVGDDWKLAVGAITSIAVVFFVGVILTRMYGTPGISAAVLGLVVLLFLVLAIGRHLRK